MTHSVLAAELDPKLNPSAAPGPTMRSLDQLVPSWDQALPAAERFKLVLGRDGVLDKETGLVWESTFGSGFSISWRGVFDSCRKSERGDRMGWRLPTVEELLTLYDPTVRGLPIGHPFGTGGAPLKFWTASVDPQSPGNFALVDMTTPVVSVTYTNQAQSSVGILCVRGG